MLLEKTTKEFEDLRNPAWRDVSGSPKKWMEHDGGSLRLSPSSTVTVSVGYLESPADLINDNDVPDFRIPAAHHAYLKFAAAAWLLRQDGDQQDEQKSQAMMQTFNSLIGASRG